MNCPGTQLAYEAAQEAPRCPRCDRLMPEGTCDCAYGIKPSPLSSKEQVVVTDDADAAKLLRSLGARHAPAIGWFLKPSRVRLFEALWKAEAVHVKLLSYRFPDGEVRDAYSASKYMRAARKAT